MKQQEGGRGDLPPPLQHRRRGRGALPPPLEHRRRGEGGPPPLDSSTYPLLVRRGGYPPPLPLGLIRPKTSKLSKKRKPETNLNKR